MVAGLLSDPSEDWTDQEKVGLTVRPHLQPGHEDVLGLSQVGGHGGLRQQRALAQPAGKGITSISGERERSFSKSKLRRPII